MASQVDLHVSFYWTRVLWVYSRDPVFRLRAIKVYLLELCLHNIICSILCKNDNFDHVNYQLLCDQLVFMPEYFIGISKPKFTACFYRWLLVTHLFTLHTTDYFCYLHINYWFDYSWHYSSTLWIPLRWSEFNVN